MLIQEVLNADAMSLTIPCEGKGNVGIGISGTWTGTVTFKASTDGLNFIDLSVTPFASGTAVQSATANGNWFTPAKNFKSIKVTFTRTTGSVQVTMAAAEDSSWQDAFLATTTIFNSSYASSGVNTLTQAAQANRAWKLEFLEVSFSGPGFGAAGRITVYDGTVAGNVLYRSFLASPVGSVGTNQLLDLPPGGITNTPGNAMTIVIDSAGSNASTINTKFSAS